MLGAQGGGGQYTYTLTPQSGVTFVTPIATANNRIEISRDNISSLPSHFVYPSGVYTVVVKVNISDQ